MKITDQKYEIFDMPKATDVLQVLQHIEKCGRICYKSEDKITDTSAHRFVSSIRDRGHWSVLEHYTFSVWVPELTFMRLQSLKDGTLNDASMRNSLKFIEISRVQFPKEEGKEFLISLSATTINNLWSNNEIFESPIENLFIFIAKDYPDLIKIPDHIDMDIKLHPDEFKYATVEDIKAVDLHRTHVFMTVKFTANRAILNEMTRHRIASYCVTGDTILYAATIQSHKKWTVKELFDWQSDIKRKGRLKLINVRSMNEENHTIVKNKIKNITLQGKQSIIKITTQSGRSIKVTKNHRMAIPSGYIEAGKLKIGDELLSNGYPALNNPDWIRWYYLEENHTRKETAEAIGCSERTLFKQFKKFGIRKPWSDRPNRKAGRGYPGMHTESFKKATSERMKGEGNHRYKKDRKSLSENASRKDARKILGNIDPICENCGSRKNIEIHHIDKDPWNNSHENLKILCPKCHHLWHHIGAIGVFREKIISIEECGEEIVYDVEMMYEPYNFVANSIVVHNSQSSTRYCNYSNDKFDNQISIIENNSIKKDSEKYFIWEKTLQICELAYKELTAAGMKPEIARDILPLALESELMMTASLFEWNHFFNMRTTHAAHPQIRDLAIPLNNEFAQLFPDVFQTKGVEV